MNGSCFPLALLGLLRIFSTANSGQGLRVRSTVEGEIVAQPGRSRAVIAAVVLAVVVHLPGITGAFLTWDDALYVTNNPRVQEASLRGLLRVWDPSDALAGRFLENWAGLRVISGCECWVLDFAFIDRVNPNEQEFRVLFSLVGLGSFGQNPFGQQAGSLGRAQNSGSELGSVY